MQEPGAAIELDPQEAFRHWTVERRWTAIGPFGHKLTIPKGYPNDRASFAPNFADPQPFEVHDFAYDMEGSGRLWDDGDPISRDHADLLLYVYMSRSADPNCRDNARCYHRFVRFLGWLPWIRGTILAKLGLMKVGFWRKKAML